VSSLKATRINITLYETKKKDFRRSIEGMYGLISSSLISSTTVKMMPVSSVSSRYTALAHTEFT